MPRYVMTAYVTQKVIYEVEAANESTAAQVEPDTKGVLVMKTEQINRVLVDRPYRRMRRDKI